MWFNDILFKTYIIYHAFTHHIYVGVHDVREHLTISNPVFEGWHPATGKYELFLVHLHNDNKNIMTIYNVTKATPKRITMSNKNSIIPMLIQWT